MKQLKEVNNLLTKLKDDIDASKNASNYNTAREAQGPDPNSKQYLISERPSQIDENFVSRTIKEEDDELNDREEVTQFNQEEELILQIQDDQETFD